MAASENVLSNITHQLRFQMAFFHVPIFEVLRVVLMIHSSGD